MRKRFVGLLLALFFLWSPALAEGITPDTTLWEIIDLPAFADCGPFLFDREYRHDRLDLTLRQLQNRYAYCDGERAARVLSEMAERAQAGTMTYLSLGEETGLFFFRGEAGAPFAVICPGGGFEYVSALTEGFPLALALNGAGYNAFVLHYRVGQGAEAACEDLAQALGEILMHAVEWGVEATGYSLWGASAGATLAAAVAEQAAPAAVILEYSNSVDWSPDTPPTYGCIGSRDALIDPVQMEQRFAALAAAGIPVEFHLYEGLGHGYGLGIGTAAEGWVDDAIAFWQAMAETRE